MAHPIEKRSLRGLNEEERHCIGGPVQAEQVLALSAPAPRNGESHDERQVRVSLPIFLLDLLIR